MAALHAISAVAFLDSVARLGTRNLLEAWLRYDVAFMAPAVGWGELHEGEAFEPCASATPLELRALLTDARARVAAELADWLDDPSPTALLDGLVARGALVRGPTGAWVAPARPRLSDVVLALFAIDIGERRETYVARLCVCKTCGRVSFDPEAGERAGCVDHPDLRARYERRIREWRTAPLVGVRSMR